MYRDVLQYYNNCNEYIYIHFIKYNTYHKLCMIETADVYISK